MARSTGSVAGAPWITVDRFPGGAVVRCTACDAGGRMSAGEVDRFVAAHSDHVSPSPGHYGAGDIVAKAARALGVQGCADCERRRVAMNRAVPKAWRR